MRFLLPLTALLFASCVAHADALARVSLAIHPCVVKGSRWLGPGIAFDLEKRLERWKHVELADRIKLNQAVRRGGEEVAPESLAAALNLDVLVTIRGSEDSGAIDLTIEVRTRNSSPTVLSVKGEASRLFDLVDRAADSIAAALISAFPVLKTSELPTSFHLPPADSVEAYRCITLGRCAVQEGDMQAARHYLTEALRLHPRSWWAHYFLGAVEFHEGHFDKAADHCRAAIDIDASTYAGVYANLAYSCAGANDDTGFRWAKSEFERRTGKPLPKRALPCPR